MKMYGFPLGFHELSGNVVSIFYTFMFKKLMLLRQLASAGDPTIAKL